MLTTMESTSAAVLAGAHPAGDRPQESASRIASIDIFRGLTMVVMILVNDLASVKGLPWWTYHFPGRQSGMTYVDVVFPAFLFILGMAIPIATARRLERGDSQPRLWGHILMRSLSLVVLGLILANARKANPLFGVLPGGVWPNIALVGAILFWLVYPKDSRHQKLYRVLKYGGVAILIVSLAVFRRTTRSGDTAWLDFGYWEILGLIGRVYLAVSILYIPLRRRLWAPPVVLAGMTALNIATRMGLRPLQRTFPYALWPFDSGELPSLAMAGIVCWQIFFEPRVASTFRRKAQLALAYAAVLLAGGWLTTPLRISKNGATPAWCLYSSGISVLVFLAVYWLADIRGWRSWAAFARPAGANTLLTYLVPDLFYFTIGASATYAALSPDHGWPGVVRAVVFTAVMLAISAWLTGRRIRMQL
jgi:heparan-alpha-glucosaminide N-acetyltransferase